MKPISTNDRCIVYDNEDRIIKYYLNQTSFDNEKNVYNKLKEKPYMPKLINIKEKIVCMERLNLPILSEYVSTNNKIPYYLINSLKKIRLELLGNGFYDWGDFFKNEHIFVDNDNYHINGFGIKIIDFDSCVPVFANEFEICKNYAVQEFKKLDADKDAFNNEFGPFKGAVIDDFFMNKEKLY